MVVAGTTKLRVETTSFADCGVTYIVRPVCLTLTMIKTSGER